MNWLRIALPVIGIALSAGGVATAQVNDCNAVLRGGTFSYSMMRNNSYYQQIVYTRFLQSTYESSKTDQSLGAGIPLGEMVMGTLSYDQSAYEAKKASIDSTNFQRITQINETQTVLVSGDSAVLNAWTNCIKNGAGGLAVRFELRNAQLATLIIDWFPQGNKYKTKLSSNITIPGVDLRASSDPSCFKKGKKIVQAVGCRSNITLPDAWTPAAVTIAATDGAADAYLPPRIRLITETEPLPPITWYKEYFRNGRSTTSPQTWLLPQAERDSNGR
ncbi:MAG: hypothetical protein Q7T84_07470 [Phenylobacterium sp.]|uniref:hypothetical protein n=1 Tax=Phenylobacterium sp. TaxID=1871053 RepID=UPI00271D82A3|nr:hypothetical protein [Phenylobacterium sp.]MDO9431125.1 hypothetical protein [Phenylobacterium sp.]